MARLEDDRFCPVCYGNYVREIVKMSGGNKNVFIDMKKMSFRCKIPRYSHDAYGNTVIVLRDCVNEKDIVYRLDEFQKKRRSGEL